MGTQGLMDRFEDWMTDVTFRIFGWLVELFNL